MGIISSEYLAGPPQVDGRVYVTEKHVDHLGHEHTREYLADLTIEPADLLAQHAAELNETLKQSQLASIEETLFSGGNPFPPDNGDFEYVTRAEALGWLLARHIGGRAEQIVKVAPLMSAVSDSEMEALGMSAETILTIRARVSSAVAIRNQLLAYNESVGA